MTTEQEWIVIEHEYVTGDESYNQISARKKVAAPSVRKRGTKGKWVDKRSQYRLELGTKALQEMLSVAKTESVERKSKIMVEDTFDAIAEIDWLLHQTKEMLKNDELARNFPANAAVLLKAIVTRNELTPKAIANDDDGWD